MRRVVSNRSVLPSKSWWIYPLVPHTEGDLTLSGGGLCLPIMRSTMAEISLPTTPGGQHPWAGRRGSQASSVAVGVAGGYGCEVADRMYFVRERAMARGRCLARAQVALRTLFRLTDWGEWVAPGVLGCAYPRTERALAALSGSGGRLLVNLHERPHGPARLRRHGLREISPAGEGLRLSLALPGRAWRGRHSRGPGGGRGGGGPLRRRPRAHGHAACVLPGEQRGARRGGGDPACSLPEAGLRGDCDPGRGGGRVGPAPGPDSRLSGRLRATAFFGGRSSGEGTGPPARPEADVARGARNPSA